MNAQNGRDLMRTYELKDLPTEHQQFAADALETAKGYPGSYVVVKPSGSVNVVSNEDYAAGWYRLVR